MPKMPRKANNVEKTRRTKRAKNAEKPIKLGMPERPGTVKMRKRLNKNTKLPEVPKKPHLPTTSEI